MLKLWVYENKNDKQDTSTVFELKENRINNFTC